MGTAAVQGRLWGAAAADFATLVEPQSAPVYDAVLDELDVQPGARVLDAGCGAGFALRMAKQRGAVVAGIDASAALLAVARERVPAAELVEGDIEELPWAEASFDAVTAFNAVQYAADPVAALRELRRVAVDGAPVAVVAWAEAERCETRVVISALGGLLPPPPPGAPGPFALSAPGRLEDLVSSAGLKPMHAAEVAAPFVFSDLGTAVRAHLSSGPARRAIEHAGQAAVEAALRAALAPSIGPDGTSRHDNAFRYVVARA